MNKKQSYPELLAERERLLKTMTGWPPVLRASLRKHGNKCGNLSCRCRDRTHPKVHGPYHYLSHRYQSKTQTVFLNKTKLGYAKRWITNYKQLIKLIYRLSEINFRILRYHYDKLEQRK